MRSRKTDSAFSLTNGDNQMTTEETLKTGTTTIGIKLKDGVILASDQRATMGNLIANSNVQKVYPLSDNLMRPIG